MVKKSQSSLTLRQLLGALSFWGTTARTALFAFIAFFTLIITLSETTTATSFDNQLMLFIYVVGSFFLLDVGFVLVSRRYTLSYYVDMLVLITAEILLGLLYVVPKLVINDAISVRVDPLTYVLFIPLLVITMRILVGMLFGKVR